jgi:hypothetical protein
MRWKINSGHWILADIFCALFWVGMDFLVNGLDQLFRLAYRFYCLMQAFLCFQLSLVSGLVAPLDGCSELQASHSHVIIIV